MRLLICSKHYRCVNCRSNFVALLFGALVRVRGR